MLTFARVNRIISEKSGILLSQPAVRRLFSFTEKSLKDIINMTYSCRVMPAMI